jgi:RNA 3'-terminal phosphate cyclase-like protein
VIIGGKVYHDCGNSRAVGYFLEPLIALGPFSKSPMNVTLNGITNDNVDISVSCQMLYALWHEKGLFMDGK